MNTRNTKASAKARRLLNVPSIINTPMEKLLAQSVMNAMDESIESGPKLTRSNRSWILHLRGRTYVHNELKVMTALLAMAYN